MFDAVDGQKNLIQMPLISGASASFSQSSCELVAELLTPSADRFVADGHTARRHGLLDIPEADREPKVEPNRIGDDFFGKSMATVEVLGHPFSIASVARLSNVTIPVGILNGVDPRYRAANSD